MVLGLRRRARRVRALRVRAPCVRAVCVRALGAVAGQVPLRRGSERVYLKMATALTATMQPPPILDLLDPRPSTGVSILAATTVAAAVTEPRAWRVPCRG